MPTDHKVEEVKKAISKLYGDTSVPMERTLERMEEIRDEVEIMIDAIRSELD